MADQLECLEDQGEGTCAGPVEYRLALSATGKSYPRCERHWEARLKTQEGINERYPYHQPPDFDPMDAGEAWGEEDY